MSDIDHLICHQSLDAAIYRAEKAERDCSLLMQEADAQRERAERAGAMLPSEEEMEAVQHLVDSDVDGHPDYAEPLRIAAAWLARIGRPTEETP